MGRGCDQQFILGMQEHTLTSWLPADSAAIGRFLAPATSLIPALTDELDDPKATLVGRSRGWGRRAVRKDILPPPETPRAVGSGHRRRPNSEFIVGNRRHRPAPGPNPSLKRARAAPSSGTRSPRDGPAPRAVDFACLVGRGATTLPLLGGETTNLSRMGNASCPCICPKSSSLLR